MNEPYDQEDLEPGRLYLAPLKDVPVSIQAGEEIIETTLDGEFLFEGATEDSDLTLRAVRSTNLWTPTLDILDGPLALAGPLEREQVEPTDEGIFQELALRMYYRPLGAEKPACQEGDAVHPLMESLAGRLEWQTSQESDTDKLSLALSLVLYRPVETYLGYVSSLKIDQAMLPLLPLQRGEAEPPQHNSLAACTGGPPPGASQEQRALKVRFISISTVETPASLESLAQEQINGACQVWWSKGGIKVVPQSTAVLADSAFGGEVASTFQEDNLPGEVSQETGSAIEIYLADKLGSGGNPRRAGGVTLNCGSFEAYVILEIDKARHNHYLLAHELGHVLGLRHPDSASATECPGGAPGSECSVMVPERPCSPRNTDNNLNAAGMFPLGAVFTRINSPSGVPLSCGRAADPEQGYFHIVRDFPADDGREPSTPQPPAARWWTHSDVWNATQGPLGGANKDQLYADSTPMFHPDHSPRHTQPLRTAVNHLLIRLHTCQQLSSPVNVHLFLTDPGASPAPSHRLTPASGLSFSHAGPNALLPGLPFTQEQTWNVPTGYPAHCCVFAVALSANQPDPGLQTLVTSPTPPSFTSLTARLKSDNDVAQRNLDIHKVSGVGGIGAPSVLPWIGLFNPSEEPAQAELEIAAHPALAELGLEIDGRHALRIKPGEEPQRISLAERLPPGRFFALRVTVSSTGRLEEGQELPIDLSFFVRGELIAGYQHLVQVAPLNEVAVQVLDGLYGALVDVSAACRLLQARMLAEQTAELVKLAGQDPRAAIKELAGMAGSFSQLGSLLQQSRSNCTDFGRRFLELAGLLSGYERLSRPRLLEHIRELADRIQQPAGQAARERVN